MCFDKSITSNILNDTRKNCWTNRDAANEMENGTVGIHANS